MSYQHRYIYRAHVVHVVDGDTYDVDVDLGMNVHVRERVRLYNVDTPEVYGVKKDSVEYAAGMAASTFVRDLIEGRDVWIETYKDAKGKYGRYIATVYIDDDMQRDLGTEIINEGHGVSVAY